MEAFSSPFRDGQMQIAYLKAVTGKSLIVKNFLPSALGGCGRIPWLAQAIKEMLKEVMHKQFLVVTRR